MKKMRDIKFLIIIITLLLIVGLLGMLVIEDQKMNQDDITFERVELIGEYQVDGGEWKEITKDTRIDVLTYHTVKFKGHFSKIIEENDNLMFRLTDLKMKFWIDGEQVYSVGYNENQSNISKTSGNRWAIVNLPLIEKENIVEIELENVYLLAHGEAYQIFLHEIYYGDVQGLYNMELRENGGSIFLGLLIFAVGIAELIMALELRFIKKEARSIFYAGFFGISTGIWTVIRFDLIGLLEPFFKATVAMDMLCLHMMFGFFAAYANHYLSEKKKKYGEYVVISIFLITAISSVLQMLGLYDIYTCSVYDVILLFALLAVILVMLYVDSFTGKVKNKSLIWVTLPSVLGGVLDLIVMLAGIATQVEWTKYGFLLTAFIQSLMLMQELKQANEKAESIHKLEMELSHNRIAVMLSQIQPHFLYNSLNTIEYLCEKDTATAKEAIEKFASYLRGNMDSLNQTELIPLEKELVHLDNYFHLEKLRFGDRVSIEYDFKEKNIFLPALTIQPIVENAIRYGITKKEEGGTVKVSSYKSGNCNYICVEDDGLGFGMEFPQYDGRSHIGIENVTRRLEAMCGGWLEMESTQGVGTKVTIVLPRDKTKDKEIDSHIEEQVIKKERNKKYGVAR